jgi:enoyl-CoA hydratase/carnithine racemase
MSNQVAPAVGLEMRGSVALLTLDDRPRKNAMSEALGDALQARVRALESDPTVRAVVLTGAGGAFSAGGDLAMLERLRSATRQESRLFMLSFYRRYLSIARLQVPTVSAIEGPAIGAGLCVAMACDLCVVDQDAKLALNFVQLGLHPGMGATHLTPLRVGPQRAAELLLTGRRFDGHEAARLGLALEAVPAAEVLPRALALAEQIAAAAPLAVRALKARSLGLDPEALERALEREAEGQSESYASRDLGEGLAAAQRRRPAVFTGS